MGRWTTGECLLGTTSVKAMRGQVAIHAELSVRQDAGDRGDSDAWLLLYSSSQENVVS